MKLIISKITHNQAEYFCYVLVKVRRDILSLNEVTADRAKNRETWRSVIRDIEVIFRKFITLRKYNLLSRKSHTIKAEDYF